MAQTEASDTRLPAPASSDVRAQPTLPSLDRKAGLWVNRYFPAILLSLGISLLLRASYFQYDFVFIDEAWWANGAKVIHEGGKLYQDVMVDKNPPIFWYCALLFKLFGVNMNAIHAGALLLVFITSILLFLIGKHFFSPSVAVAACLIHAVASTTYYIPRIIGMTTETLMVVFSTAALYSYLAAVTQGRQLAYLGAGLFSSFAFLTKPVAITESLFFVLFVVFIAGTTVRTRLRSLAILLAGFALGLGAFLGYMLGEGILFAWWQQAVLDGFRYVGRIGITEFSMKFVRASAAFAVIYAWLCIPICRSWRTGWREGLPYRIAALWLLSAFAGVVIGRRFYANYFIQVMPPLALMGAIGLVHLWKLRAQPRARLAGRLCCAAFLISFIWFHSRTFVQYSFLLVPGMRERACLWDMCAEDKRVREIAEYLRAMTRSDDRIFVWGSKSQLYFLAERPMATAYLDFDVGDDFPPGAGEPAVQERTAALLRQSLPRYMADVQQVARIEYFAPFRALIEEHYDFETEMHGVRLYRLRRTDAEAIAESKDYPEPPPY